MLKQPEFSANGERALKKFEGVRYLAYRCSANVMTIGVGHTAATGEPVRYADGTVSKQVLPNKKITEAESDRLMKVDMAMFARKVDALLKVQLNVNQHDAALLLAYNIGVGAFGKSTVLRRINAGDFKGAADAFAMWNKAGGRVVKGLVTRRSEEARLFRTPASGTFKVAELDFDDMPQAVDNEDGTPFSDFSMVA